jgi:hypothetical protein
MKTKKRDLITGIIPGQVIKLTNGELIMVTEVYSTWIKGNLYNTPKVDQFDNGERIGDKFNIVKESNPCA